MKSWRTTLCGILTLIGAGIALVAVPLLDGNPDTAANWTGMGAAITAAFGLFLARDNKVSSEKAGIK